MECKGVVSTNAVKEIGRYEHQLRDMTTDDYLKGVEQGSRSRLEEKRDQVWQQQKKIKNHGCGGPSGTISAQDEEESGNSTPKRYN